MIEEMHSIGAPVLARCLRPCCLAFSAPPGTHMVLPLRSGLGRCCPILMRLNLSLWVPSVTHRASTPGMGKAILRRVLEFFPDVLIRCRHLGSRLARYLVGMSNDPVAYGRLIGTCRGGALRIGHCGGLPAGAPGNRRKRRDGHRSARSTSERRRLISSCWTRITQTTVSLAGSRGHGHLDRAGANPAHRSQTLAPGHVG